MKTKLLVIIPDRLSALIEKGEVTPRYYNPGNLFDEVHIMMTNDDRPDVKVVQAMVGDAKLFLHNNPEPPHFFKLTFGWRPWLMKKWANTAVITAKAIKPDLIRCHGNHLNAYLAAQIKKALGIPYIISMHINPEADIRKHSKKEMSIKNHFIYCLQRSFEKIAMTSADTVVCVYNFIKPYAKQYGAKDIRIIYNVINTDNIPYKQNYAIEGKFKILISGRQFIKKDPTPLIEALGLLPQVTLTLIGDGPYHEQLKQKSIILGVATRCNFIKAQENLKLCQSLATYDAFVSINDYGGISKVELEAAHAGLPIITNAHPLEEKPEILENNCIVVDGDKNSYIEAITILSCNQHLREKIGSQVRVVVQHLKGPVTENEYVKLYKEYLSP